MIHIGILALVEKNCSVPTRMFDKIGGLDMDIPVYIRQVSFSDKTSGIEGSGRILFLGLIGEIGSLLSECKKSLREGKSNRFHAKQKLIQEIGDSLWYLTAIALRYDLDLRTDVMQANISHIKSLKTTTQTTRDNISMLLNKCESRLPLTFEEFQEIAWQTITEEIHSNEDALLARLIRKSANLMKYFSYGKLQEKDITSSHLERILGDILWYLTVFAKNNDINLNTVAQENYSKTVGRWKMEGSIPTKRLDSRDKPEERFPEKMSFVVMPKGCESVEVLFEDQNIFVGDPLDDNAYIEDGYRYHDAFHMAFAAILTWSPVLRKLLRLGKGELLNSGKNFHRFHSKEKANAEDGARARITEEAIAKIVHSYATEVDGERLLADKKVVSTEILDQIRIFTKHYEVHMVKQWEWEIAIIEACKIYVALRENGGGRVKLNLKERSILFEKIQRVKK